MTRWSSPPILTCAEAGAFEQQFFGGDEARAWAAMLRAGRGVGAAVLTDYAEVGPFPAHARLLVLVGKGNNGGDALIAAGEILRRQPGARAVCAFLLGERSLQPRARRAWQDLVHQGGPRVAAASTEGWAAPGAAYTVVLDGVFGYSYRPPLPPAVAAALERANALPADLRAAVDLPSGWGEPAGFRADFTYATGVIKSPLLDCPAAGRVRLIDLDFFPPGSPPLPAADRVLTPALLEPLRGLRPARTDKRTYGHLLIAGGSRQFPGAVLMNVLAALHSGAGLVTAVVPASLAAAYAARAPEAMWVGAPETAAGALGLAAVPIFQERAKRASAVALGSGLGREAESLAAARAIVAASEVPVLVDADALQPDIVAAARAPLVLTPHAGEYARLAGNQDLRTYCSTTGATVVAKGPVTRLCTGGDSATVYHGFGGGPVLARGGSGDLLAGLVAGQLAQVAARPEQLASEDLLAAVGRGVVWHGLAADRLARARGQTAVAITDLIAFLPDCLRTAAETR